MLYNMNEQKEKLMQLVDDLKNYLNVRIRIATLGVYEVVSKLLASLITNSVMLLFVFLFLLFGSVAAGFGLGEWLNSAALGFAIVAGFYLLLVLIILFTKSKLIEKPLVNMIIKQLLKNLSESEDEKN